MLRCCATPTCPAVCLSSLLFFWGDPGRTGVGPGRAGRYLCMCCDAPSKICTPTEHVQPKSQSWTRKKVRPEPGSPPLPFPGPREGRSSSTSDTAEHSVLISHLLQRIIVVIAGRSLYLARLCLCDALLGEGGTCRGLLLAACLLPVCITHRKNIPGTEYGVGT